MHTHTNTHKHTHRQRPTHRNVPEGAWAGDSLCVGARAAVTWDSLPGQRSGAGAETAKPPPPSDPPYQDAMTTQGPMTDLQCQVSSQTALHLARDNPQDLGQKSTVHRGGKNRLYCNLSTVRSSHMSQKMFSCLLTYRLHQEGISFNLDQLKAN